MKGVSLYTFRSCPTRHPSPHRRGERIMERTAVGILQRVYSVLSNLMALTPPNILREKVFPALEKPADFKKLQKRPEEMSARYMYATIQKQEKEGLDATRTWIDLHQKLSYPFISVVLALIGIPLSIRSSRKGGLLCSVSG